MLQLKNNTPFSAAIALFPNEQGIETLYTIVKASFRIGQQWTLMDEQAPPQQEDIFWGEPGESSLRLPSDYHPGKAATDVIMIGQACAQEQKPVRQLDVGLSVGSIGKTVRVFGDRFWDRGLISSPDVFMVMPVIYERAFGGKDILEGQVRAAELRNPVGVGFQGKRDSADMESSPLPNVECPRQLIQSLKDNPAPAGFAPIASNWHSRVAYAGTYDEAWSQNRAPYLPLDYDKRFMNSAHPDLIYPGFLQGGEPVRIFGMHPSGELTFNLPNLVLRNKIEVANQVEEGNFMMESVIIEPNQLQLSMVWKSAFICGRNARKINQVSVGMQR
ncbi:DUF2169 domain-containing protein [Cellvibrio sp. PSBB006]|uniref:DUF2169 family type VI secretion system accessory protein n=1 Tax=Cellvibrio sp. PSBB006 TaxID=1987723 RepID=UPI000B3B96FF|nr:DUF2169 domain-containing protein [Cellvibrio sp. PSBB006]ARU26527.1 hypothetical protein CBR65_03330 [Cellvibrio sp. PSBB006]